MSGNFETIDSLALIRGIWVTELSPEILRQAKVKPLQNEFEYKSDQHFMTGKSMRFNGFFTVATEHGRDTGVILTMFRRKLDVDVLDVVGHGTNKFGRFVTRGLARGPYICLRRTYV